MRARLAALALAAALGCGIAARDGQFLCPDGACPAGLACVAGVCREPGRDGGAALDASPADGAPSTDAPGADVPDALEAPDAPPPPESCAPEARTRVPRDEDLDGLVDEGCPIHLGPIHPAVAAMPVAADYWGAELTDDGLALVFVPSNGAAGATCGVARRAAVTEPFAAFRVLAGSRATGVEPVMVTVTGDGRELVVQGTERASGAVRLYATRGTIDAGYDGLRVISELSTVGEAQLHPSLSRDGLELFFVSRAAPTAPRTIYHARRAARDGAWGTPAAVGPGAFPRPSPDGLTLYFLDDAADTARVLARASRAASFPPTSTGAEWAPLGAAAEHVVLPAFHAATREVFFTYEPRASTTEQPWISPVMHPLMRAEVCRDGACVSPPIACPSGRQSTDGLHCYRIVGPPADFAAATAACGTSSHLPTLLSFDEEAAVLFLLGSTSFPWIGARGETWLTGEPMLRYAWEAPVAPTDCSWLGVLAWFTGACTDVRPVVCENEVWPSFVTE